MRAGRYDPSGVCDVFRYQSSMEGILTKTVTSLCNPKARFCGGRPRCDVWVACTPRCGIFLIVGRPTLEMPLELEKVTTVVTLGLFSALLTQLVTHKRKHPESPQTKLESSPALILPRPDWDP